MVIHKEIEFEFDGEKYTVACDMQKLMDLERWMGIRANKIFQKADSFMTEDLVNGVCAILCRHGKWIGMTKVAMQQEVLSIFQRDMYGPKLVDNAVFEDSITRAILSVYTVSTAGMDVQSYIDKIKKDVMEAAEKKSKPTPVKTRGRPKKTATKKKSTVKKKRGRPRKNPEVQATA